MNMNATIKINVREYEALEAYFAAADAADLAEFYHVNALRVAMSPNSIELPEQKPYGVDMFTLLNLLESPDCEEYVTDAIESVRTKIERVVYAADYVTA